MAPEEVHTVEFWLKWAQESSYSAKALCRKLDRSRSQLQRLTRSLFGCSPQRLLDLLRMLLAPALLRQGPSIKGVSSSLGFKCPGQFSRAFHAYYGSSPSDFLRAGAESVSNPGIDAFREKFFDLFPAMSWARAPRQNGGENQPKARAPGRPRHRIHLTLSERAQLEELTRSQAVEPRVARRARVLLALSEAQPRVGRVAKEFRLSRQGIWALCRRYRERGPEALKDAPRHGRPHRNRGAAPQKVT